MVTNPVCLDAVLKIEKKGIKMLAHDPEDCVDTNEDGLETMTPFTEQAFGANNRMLNPYDNLMSMTEMDGSVVDSVEQKFTVPKVVKRRGRKKLAEVLKAGLFYAFVR